MFNPMAPHELMIAVGRVLRAAAQPDAGDHEFQRSQLLSAYSVTRHLAAEQAASADLVAWLRAALTDALTGDEPSVTARAREAIAGARTGPEFGAAVGDLLDALGPGDADAALRRRLHRVLAEMADREVDALARAA
jgi:hypothetical protein